MFGIGIWQDLNELLLPVPETLRDLQLGLRHPDVDGSVPIGLSCRIALGLDGEALEIA